MRQPPENANGNCRGAAAREDVLQYGQKLIKGNSRNLQRASLETVAEIQNPGLPS
jgi:hypothetical protein